MRPKQNGKEKISTKLIEKKHYRWLEVSNTIVITAAIMSFGAVSYFWMGMNDKNAILTLAIIPPMVITTMLTGHFTVKAIQKRTIPLIEAIEQVAEGDLDVQLDLKEAGEYEDIYQSFNQMVRELKSTKEEMQNFLNEYSYEFKTPITSICGFSDYLIETGCETETPERMKKLEIIRDESRRLSELSQNMLKLSRVEAIQIVTDITQFNLSEQIKQCVILLLPPIEKKNIDLDTQNMLKLSRVEAIQIVTDITQFNLSEQIKQCVILLLPPIEKKNIDLDINLPDQISYYGNPELTEQVWINLLNNAIKFTPHNGEITISARQEPDQIRISVSDTGVGMDEEIRDHIFERYYQCDYHKGGNGIGLSIVNRIVTLCGGSITVESTPGEGSTFQIILPN